MNYIVAFSRRIRPYQVVFIFLVGLCAATLAANDGDPKAFVTISSCYIQCDVNLPCRAILRGERSPEEFEGVLVEDTVGYDGTFFYAMARDPLHAADCLDVPAYRYQRILLPLVVHVLTLGYTELFPFAFVFVNGLSLIISTILLEDLLIQLGRSRWYALTYGLFFGALVGVRLSTAEPFAYVLVIGAIWFEQRGKPIWTIILMTLAAFAKEPTGLFVAGFMLYYLLERRWRDLLLMGIIVGGTFGLWQLHLHNTLGAYGLTSGAPPERIPYNGLWLIWTEGHFLAFLVLGALFIPSVVIPSLWGLWATIREFLSGEYHLYTCLYFAVLSFIPFVPFSTFSEYLGIYRLIVGMVFMHVLYAALRYPQRPLNYSTLWIVLVLIFPWILETNYTYSL
ncbi:MAG: hypothetical protein CUN55_10400 [Phototrophicales bacterium]|nr:MAG: hypothetical protein CUN55_10400 [Phototrophicales bacterium]